MNSTTFSPGKWAKYSLTLIAFALSPAVTQAQSESKIKNVLMVVSDDLKASVLGCYGDKICETPNIDQLAQTGVVFNRAYCQGTWCAPSRQSFMHSRYQSGGKINLGMHFQQQGLYSARVGKIYHMRVPGDIIAGTNGLDIQSTWTERFNSAGQEAHTPGDYACLNLDVFTKNLANRESTKMPNRPYVTVSYEGTGADQPDFKSAVKAIEILQQRKADEQPFFLAVGLVRPHYPMVAPKQYFDRYPWQDVVLPDTVANDHSDIPKRGMGKITSFNNQQGRSIENKKKMWAGYYASVTFMDDQVGKILSELERLNLRDSTAVVFISDHGYHLGEHEFWLKSNLHEEVARVPMIISAPGFKRGVTDSLVELVDLYPTLSRLAGFDFPEEVQGKSLVPILEDLTSKVRLAALTLNKGGLAIRTKDWAYMQYPDKTEELYNMNSDPEQFTNLAGSEKYKGILLEMRATLKARVSQEELVLANAKKAKNKKK